MDYTNQKHTAKHWNTEEFVEFKIAHRKVVLFEKSSTPSCKQCHKIIDQYNLNKDKSGVFEAVNIEDRQDCAQLEDYLHTKTLYDRREVPHLFVNGVHVGGGDAIRRHHDSGALLQTFRDAGITGLL